MRNVCVCACVRAGTNIVRCHTMSNCARLGGMGVQTKLSLPKRMPCAMHYNVIKL